MKRVEYRDTIHGEDIEFLAYDLSEESKRGLVALGHDPLQSLIDGVRESARVRVVLVDGFVAGIFGIVPREWGGQLWFLTGTVVERLPKAFARAIPDTFRYLCKGFPMVANIAHCQNKFSLNMAKHFGFKIYNPTPYGPHGELFHAVKWEAPNVHRG